MGEVLTTLTDAEHRPDDAQGVRDLLDATLQNDVGNSRLLLDLIGSGRRLRRDDAGIDDQVRVKSGDRVGRRRRSGPAQPADDWQSSELSRDVSALPARQRLAPAD